MNPAEQNRRGGSWRLREWENGTQGVGVGRTGVLVSLEAVCNPNTTHAVEMLAPCLQHPFQSSPTCELRSGARVRQQKTYAWIAKA